MEVKASSIQVIKWGFVSRTTYLDVIVLRSSVYYYNYSAITLASSQSTSKKASFERSHDPTSVEIMTSQF